MKNKVLGFIVVMMLALGTVASAQAFFGFFLTVEQAAGNTVDFQVGYVAGISDTVELFRILQEAPNGNGKGIDWDQIKRLATCLDTHGKTTRTLQEFAVGIWKSHPASEPNVNAATLLFARACDK